MMQFKWIVILKQSIEFLVMCILYINSLVSTYPSQMNARFARIFHSLIYPVIHFGQ